MSAVVRSRINPTLNLGVSARECESRGVVVIAGGEVDHLGIHIYREPTIMDAVVSLGDQNPRLRWGGPRDRIDGAIQAEIIIARPDPVAVHVGIHGDGSNAVSHLPEHFDLTLVARVPDHGGILHLRFRMGSMGIVVAIDEQAGFDVVQSRFG